MARFSGFFTFLIVLFPLSSCFTRGAEVSISAAEGQDCVLPCFGPEELKVSVLEWTEFNQPRNGTVLKKIPLDQGRDLLIYRAGNVMKGYEHPDYTNRVELLDPQLKNGTLSVVLKNVTFNDTGTYRCLTLYDGQEKGLISHLIRLNVTERDKPSMERTQRRAHGLIIGLIIGLSLLGLVGLIAVIIITARCRRIRLWTEQMTEAR